MLPKTGNVIDYPYLWRWQRDREESEGRKPRPVCVAIALQKGVSTHLALLPISSKPPRADQVAIEIPENELLRVGLSQKRGAWVYVSEFNFDIAERSFYLQPMRTEAKSFSTEFMKCVLTAFRPTLLSKQSNINRTV